MNMIHVVAITETIKEKAPKLEKICQTLIEPTRNEKGCISYNFFRDLQQPGKFVFLEEWESKNDLDAHLQSNHFIKASQAMKSITINEPQVLILNKVK